MSSRIFHKRSLSPGVHKAIGAAWSVPYVCPFLGKLAEHCLSMVVLLYGS